MQQKVLIVTNTYFQLLVAVHLKRTVYREDDVDVIITNHSAGCLRVSSRLGETKLFRNVFYLSDNDGKHDRSVWNKIVRYVVGRIFPHHTLKKYGHINNDYTQFLFCNASHLTHLIRIVFRKQVQCYRFEEGFSTYTKPLLEKKFVRRMLICTVYGSLSKHINGLYLFHPEYFKQKVNYPLIQMKNLNKKDDVLKQVLNYAFEYTPGSCSIKEKYIFFEESFRASGVKMDDTTLLKAISDVVGIDNLIIKRHPRSTTDNFCETGIKKMEQFHIPWELILMNEDMSEKTLLTITSGSALADTLYFNGPAQVYLLFQCTTCVSPILDEKYLNYLADIYQKRKDLIIPKDMNTFLDMLCETQEK